MLKLVLELGPIVLFVLSYKFGDGLIAALELNEPFSRPIFVATAVIMVATLVVDCDFLVDNPNLASHADCHRRRSFDIWRTDPVSAR